MIRFAITSPMPGSLISSRAVARFRLRQGSFGLVSAPDALSSRFDDNSAEFLFVMLSVVLQDAIAKSATDRTNSFMLTEFPRRGLEGSFQRIQSARPLTFAAHNAVNA